MDLEVRHLNISINDLEKQRLSKALETKNYDGLCSWRELFIYQMSCKNIAHIQEIRRLAERKNRGEKIVLPLNSL